MAKGQKFQAWAVVFWAVLAGTMLAQTPATKGAKPPFVVVEPFFQYPDTLDPHMSVNAEIFRFWRPVYETPLICDPNSPVLTLKPGLLAEMPKIEDGAKKMTLVFKKGIRYADHDCFKGGYGRAVGAKDFVRVLQRHIDPLTKSPMYEPYLAGRIVGIDAVRKDALDTGRLNMNMAISGVKIVDDLTVEIRFTEPYALFETFLAMPFTAIMPDEAMQRYGAQMSEIMVGTGPYVQDREASTPLSIVFKPNPNYWANEGAATKLPMNDGVRFEITPKLEMWMNRFEAGDLSFVDLYPANVADYVNSLGRAKGIVKPAKSTVVKSDLSRLHYIVFNTKNKFLGKKEVRQAMALAVNRDWYQEKYYRGAGTLADHHVPPSLPLDAPKASYPWAYGKRDLKRAQELMAKAGYAYGKDLPEFILETSGKTVIDEAESQMLKEAWAKIGVRVQIRLEDYPELMARSRDGLNEISINHWYADYPDAENFFLMLESSHVPKRGQNVDAPNVGFYTNPEYDTLYREAFALAPGQKRGELFEKMIQIVQEDCPWIFIAWPARISLVAPGVQGVVTRSVYASTYPLIRRP